MKGWLTFDGREAIFTAKAGSISPGSVPARKPLRSAASSMEARSTSAGPTRRPTCASVIVSGPVLTTVPWMVRVSPFTGALGAMETSWTSTEEACAASAFVAGE